MKLSSPRNNLDVLLYLHNAHYLIAQVKTKHENLQRDKDLSNLLSHLLDKNLAAHYTLEQVKMYS